MPLTERYCLLSLVMRVVQSVGCLLSSSCFSSFFQLSILSVLEVSGFGELSRFSLKTEQGIGEFLVRLN